MSQIFQSLRIDPNKTSKLDFSSIEFLIESTKLIKSLIKSLNLINSFNFCPIDF
jgi:hypothetical protein